MIEGILPASVVAVEAWEDPPDVRLFAQEQLIVGKAVDKRLREFTTARMCARDALQRLGHPPAPILAGERGEPQWPAGVVGSITHTGSYRACAVARSSKIVGIGIDAEPNAPLPDGLLGDIARPEELPLLRALEAEHPHVHWGRLLFSAKEAVYKTWFPLATRWLGFEDAVVEIDPLAGTFTARLLVEGPQLLDGPLRELRGRWMVGEGIILTAIALGSS